MVMSAFGRWFAERAAAPWPWGRRSSPTWTSSWGTSRPQTTSRSSAWAANRSEPADQSRGDRVALRVRAWCRGPGDPGRRLLSGQDMGNAIGERWLAGLGRRSRRHGLRRRRVLAGLVLRALGLGLRARGRRRGGRGHRDGLTARRDDREVAIEARDGEHLLQVLAH